MIPYYPDEKPDSSKEMMGIPMLQVNAVPSSPVVAGGIVYFGSKNGYFYALRYSQESLFQILSGIAYQLR